MKSSKHTSSDHKLPIQHSLPKPTHNTHTTGVDPLTTHTHHGGIHTSFTHISTQSEQIGQNITQPSHIQHNQGVIQRHPYLAHVPNPHIIQPIHITEAGTQVIQRNPDDEFLRSLDSFELILPEPLDRYTMLKKRARPIWDRLNEEAKRLAYPELSLQEDYCEDLSHTVPVKDLLQPRIYTATSKSIHSVREHLFDTLSYSSISPAVIGGEIADIFLGRWAQQNGHLFNADVEITLIPQSIKPDGWGRTSSFSLAFAINGHSISSFDGSISVLELDLWGSNNLELIIQQVTSDALIVAQAAELFRLGTMATDHEWGFWRQVDQNFDKVSLNTIQRHFNIFSLRQTRDGSFLPSLPFQLTLFCKSHSEYEDVLRPLEHDLNDLNEYASAIWTDYLIYHEEVSSSHDMTSMREIVDHHWEDTDGWLDKIEAGTASTLYFIANNVLLAGHLDAMHESAKAFKAGTISYDQYMEISAKSILRATAVGAVMVGLTIATAGLAGPVLGPSASLGARVVYGGVTSGISSVITEATTHTITEVGSFDDPTQQRIWDMGKRTPEQILISGLIGVGTGVGQALAGAAIGKIAVSLRGSSDPVSDVTSMVLRSGDELAPTTGGSQLPSGPKSLSSAGWRAEKITADAVRLTRPDLIGEVIVTTTHLRYQVPTGNGMHVQYTVPLVDMPGFGGATPKLTGSPLLPAPRAQLPGPKAPSMPPMPPRVRLPDTPPPPTPVTPRQTQPIGLLTDNPRYHIRNMQEYEFRVANPPQKPEGLDEVGSRLWDDYLRYYYKRLGTIGEALGKGSGTYTSPRQWHSYRELIEGHRGWTGRGRAHQDRVTSTMTQPIDPSTPVPDDGIWNTYLTESDVGLSRVKKPSGEKGTIVYVDQLVLDLEEQSLTAVSNKSRDFLVRAGEYTSAELAVIRKQVEADVVELFEKYSGELFVRRKSHPLYGKKIDVDDVILVYELDKGLVNDNLARQVISIAEDQARLIDNSINFHVTFQ